MAINVIKNMRHIHDPHPVPFLIELTENKAPLICEKIIRLVPKKRLVALGTWEGKNVIIKLFFSSKNAKKHGFREVSGIKKLIAARIPTPDLLYYGMAFHDPLFVLVLEYIPHGQHISINEIKEKENQLEAIVLELATQHVFGIVQRDLHFNNFLITDNIIYTLDGSQIQKKQSPLSKKESLQHVSILFSQLGAGTDKLKEKLFEVYAKSRGWVMKDREKKKLCVLVQKRIQKRWAHYQKKIFSTCTAFLSLKKWNEWIVYDRQYASDDFLQFLKNPNFIFDQYGTTVIKAGRSSTVAKIRLANREFVVKRYNIKNGWHALRRCFRPTRAVKNWRLSQYLTWMGVATAKPVAFIEKRFLGLRLQSYFIMEFISGVDAGDYFSEPRNQKNAKSILQLFENLRELHLTHGDLKTKNIIMQKDNPVLIDLDGMQYHHTKKSLSHGIKKDKQRWMKNWENQSEIKDLFQDRKHP